jgi:hypothetical protein
MTTFQFDECINDARLVERCNSEGLCKVLRFPSKLRGKKDFEILPELLTREFPLVTRDFRILDENKEFVPEIHPGVIVLRSKRASDTFTTKKAAQNLSKFKSRFASWSEADWKGLFLEIDEEGVYIFNSIERSEASGLTVNFSDGEFTDKFRQALTALSMRGISSAGGSSQIE